VARPDVRASVAHDVERDVVTQLPDVEIVDVQVSGSVLRVLIDHPDGVDHTLCGRVANVLGKYTNRYQLEVSSPGIPRPLIRPSHFQRNVGKEIAVETRQAIDGRRRFNGALRGADDEQIVLELPDREEPLPIPLALVRKSHLVEES
jgi:ribosome maturation factor RimP